MATSPLFGWEEPDDVDLVKDGAAAIRTLGNAIDTSMGDLLGGTTGQVLSKASNTNMDFTWVTSDDANAIQNTIVDAKGDLIAASASDTPARLAVGADYTIVQALASTSTGLTYGGGWTSYTPVWTAATTNPVIGNGILEGVYRRIGSICEFAIKLSAGSTTTFGTGVYRLSLPIVALDSGWNGTYQVGILDNGVAWYHKYYGFGFADGFNDKFIIADSGSNYWSNTAPFTFGNTDSVYVQGRYRVGA
jgi:hypothetical protein